MEVLWMLIGGGIAWFVFSFRATKTKMKHIAGVEFEHFRKALIAWDEDRDNMESQLQALHHLEVFNTRYSDFLSDPTGRTLPAARAVLSRSFVDHMRDRGLVGVTGKPNKYMGDGNATSFWLSVECLTEMRRNLLNSDPFEERNESDAVQKRKAQVSAMTEYLRPYSGSVAEVWEHMEAAFLASMGRPVNKNDDYDLMTCHAAIAPFNFEASEA